MNHVRNGWCEEYGKLRGGSGRGSGPGYGRSIGGCSCGGFRAVQRPRRKILRILDISDVGVFSLKAA